MELFMKKSILTFIVSTAFIAITPVFAMKNDSLKDEKRSLWVHSQEKMDIEKYCETPIISISLQNLPKELWAHKDVWKAIGKFLHPRDVSSFQQSGKLVGIAFPDMLEASICARIEPIKLRISFTLNTPAKGVIKFLNIKPQNQQY
jgi:hypothetical protein